MLYRQFNLLIEFEINISKQGTPIPAPIESYVINKCNKRFKDVKRLKRF